MIPCHLSLSENPSNYAPVVLAHYIRSHPPLMPTELILQFNANQSVLFTPTGLKFSKTTAILRYLARVYLPEWYEIHHGIKNPEKATTIDTFLHEVLHGQVNDIFVQELSKMNEYLKFRSFMVGYHWSLADLYLWGALKAIPAFQAYFTNDTSCPFPYLMRWYLSIDQLPFVQEALTTFYSTTATTTTTTIQTTKTKHQTKPTPSERSTSSSTSNKNKNNPISSTTTTTTTTAPPPSHDPMDLALPHAELGKVVTRFPPEPSGYMHIGHAKAAMLNAYFAEKYQGKLIFRLDDTNPENESMEYELAIKEDLKTLGIQYHQCTRTSDYFDALLTYAEQLISQGDAYVDDTDVETMRLERMKGIASKHRNRSIQDNIKYWKEMKLGTEVGLNCCLRAKMNYQDANKALRDPVLYRCLVSTSHQHTGHLYKVYPTYDFACPIVDSLEGVTHALRTNEYRDRNPQYEWVQTKLNLRSVFIWDFSRLNFVYTLLSKRKLNWFIKEQLISNWNDPRFPTIRGLIRRGLTVPALRDFILLQGASTKTMLLEWDKLWSLNKKVLDPITPRHVVIEHPIDVFIQPEEEEEKSEQEPGKKGKVGSLVEPYCESILKHKKNPSLGTKTTWYSNHLYIEAKDTIDIQVGEEITLMDWGNAIITEIGSHHLSLKLHLQGNVKCTKKKWTWLSAQHCTGVYLKDYDYLITKKKLDPTDDFKSFLNPQSELVYQGLGDLNLLSLPLGSHLQLERKGYYYLDPIQDPLLQQLKQQPSSSPSTKDTLNLKRSPPLVLIAIPDGRMSSVSLKYAPPSTSVSIPSSTTNAVPLVSSKVNLAPFFSTPPVDEQKRKKSASPPRSQDKETTKASSKSPERSPTSSSSPSSKSNSKSRSPSKSRSKSPNARK